MTTPTPYTRPEVEEEEQMKIGKMIMRIVSIKGVNHLVKVCVALGIENARLLAECNEHRRTLGIEPLPEFEPK